MRKGSCIVILVTMCIALAGCKSRQNISDAAPVGEITEPITIAPTSSPVYTITDHESQEESDSNDDYPGSAYENYGVETFFDRIMETTEP